MFLLPSQSRCDEPAAFPSRLRSAVRDTATPFLAEETLPSRHAFMVNFQREALHIPYRLYYPEALLHEQVEGADGMHRLILACLGTRHHSGYLRQHYLREVVVSDAAWCMPYILQLASEYVVAIVEDVATALANRDPSALAAFAKENPAYLATFQKRVRSYWSCYYRRTHPHFDDYPGAKVLALLKQHPA